jgi:hypothetical protein
MTNVVPFPDDCKKTLDEALAAGPNVPRFAKRLFIQTVACWAAVHKTGEKDDRRITRACDEAGVRPILRAAARASGRSENQVMAELKEASRRRRC